MCLLVLIYLVRGFPTVVPWFLQNFLGVGGWGLDGWFLDINDHSCILFGLFFLSELVKYFAY